MAAAYPALTVPVLVCALAMPLAGCLRDPIVSARNVAPVGNWRVERQIDRATGAPISSAYLETRNSSHTGIAFSQPAGMQVSCFKNAPLVHFTFGYQIGSTRNAEFAYRFDDKPGRTIKVRFVDDYKSVVIEGPNEVAQFLDEMESSAALYVLIRSFNRGRTSADFKLEGGADAIKEALAGCPPGQATKRVS